jgi:hypothetical protein
MFASESIGRGKGFTKLHEIPSLYLLALDYDYDDDGRLFRTQCSRCVRLEREREAVDGKKKLKKVEH